jgi:quinol monooxygenase YgiN
MNGRFIECRRTIRFLLVAMCAALPLGQHGSAHAQQSKMLVRISEIEVFSQRLEEYQRILNEEAAASMRVEPGVLCIFPMAQKDSPTHIRILEIYASREAYDAHIQSPHFQKYKGSTLEMVKSLPLVDMASLDADAMPLIFKKTEARP